MPAPSLNLPRRALVPIGGGKDSLVSIETLKRAGEAFAVVWIGRSDLIRACAQATGQPLLNIERELAPELFELNRQGAWNGHIPVTAINSAILTLAALLYGYDEIVFSNEASASVGNLTHNDLDINHQWSKGLRFEARFGDYLRQNVAADLNYYSLLRPFSELAVTERFAPLTRYHGVFSSCNRNFRILGAKPSARWCGECPKCRFVFLALAPFMSKPALLAIFGRNLLDESEQIEGFDALLEFHATKPFECVGEGRESRAALLALSERADWREDQIVRRFVDDVLPAIERSGLALAPMLQPAGEHRIPQRLWGCAASLSNLKGLGCTLIVRPWFAAISAASLATDLPCVGRGCGGAHHRLRPDSIPAGRSDRCAAFAGGFRRWPRSGSGMLCRTRPPAAAPRIQRESAGPWHRAPRHRRGRAVRRSVARRGCASSG